MELELVPVTFSNSKGWRFRMFIQSLSHHPSSKPQLCHNDEKQTTILNRALLPPYTYKPFSGNNSFPLLGEHDGSAHWIRKLKKTKIAACFFSFFRIRDKQKLQNAAIGHSWPPVRASQCTVYMTRTFNKKREWEKRKRVWKSDKKKKWVAISDSLESGSISFVYSLNHSFTLRYL